VVVGAAVLVASLVGAVLGSTFLADTDAPAEQSVLRFTVPTPELQFRGYSAGLHFTPDGRTLAYHGENLELRLRDLSTWEARSVPGTANSRDGFLSPDGRWFAYMNSSEGTLDKVLLDGGTPVTLVRGIGIFNSGAWSGDGVLYFTGGVDGQVDLWRLDEDGSNLRPVIETEPTAGKSFYGQLQLLPGYEALLVTRVPDELEASGAEVEDAQVWALVLDDLSFKPLIEGASQARYLPGGYLAVLMAGGSLSVVEFDLEAIEVRGTPRRVVDAIRQNDGYINGRWTVSASGSLAYVAPPEAVEPGRLLWVEPDGSLSTAVEVPRTTRAGFSYDARLGPAGRTVALSLAGTSGRVNVWLLDVERGTGAPFLPGQSWESFSPSWSPDGTRLAFVRATSMFRGGDVKVAPVDGSAPAQTIYQSPDDDGDIVVRDLSLGNWTPDGNRLCFTQTSPRGRSDIWVADTTPGGSSEMVVGTEADEVSPQFSPDGGWLAYSSNVTGRMEVYLRAYPQGSRDIPVSRNGGEAPVWSPDGTRLYYREGSVLVAVDTDLRGGNGSAVQIGRAVSLAELPPGIDADYTVDRDSGRILLAQGTRIPDAEEIHVILGFADEIHAGALGRDP